MLHIWRRLHVSAKIILTIIAVLALPIAIFGAAYIGRETALLSENVSAKVAADLAAKATVTEKRLAAIKNAAHLLAIEVPFEVVTDVAGTDRDEGLEDFISKFTTAARTIRFLEEDFEEVRVYHDDKAIADAAPALRYVEDFAANPFFRPIIADRADSERWVYDHSGDAVPQVIKLGKLCSLFLTLRGPTATAVIEVSMLTSRLFTNIRSTPFSDYFWAVELPSSDFILPDDPAAYAAVGLTEESAVRYLRAIEKGIRGSVPLRINGVESEIQYRFLPASSIYLYAIAPTNESVRRLEDLRSLVLRGVFLLLLAVSALVALIVRGNLKRLDVMVHAIRRVESGDFTVPVLVAGEDEIAELSHHFQRLIDRLNSLIYETARKETAKIESRTRALLAQINAHFIYNVLESVRMRAYDRDAAELPDIVSSLGRMLRFSMSWERQFVTMAEELQNAEDFVDLVNFRFDFRTLLDIDVPPESRSKTVIKMILQPIVENSVKHGMDAGLKETRISVRAWISGELLLIEAADSGPGISESKSVELNTRLAAFADPDDGDNGGGSIGLMNIAERIRLYCGEAYGISLSPGSEGGTVVTIRLPLFHSEERIL